MREAPSCLCGSKALKRVFSPSFGIQKLYRCATCGLVQLYPMPASNGVTDIYNDPSYLSKISEREYYGYYKALEEHMRLHLHLPKLVSVLDFGAGRCYYHRFFLTDGYREVHSLEINHHLARYARERLGLNDVFTDSCQLSRLHYDVVIANQVFEHLVNPLDTLTKAIKPLLKANGIVCFTVPNWNSFNRIVLRKRWLGYSPEEHIWYFGKQSIQGLLRNNRDYELLDIRVYSAVGKSYDGFRPNEIVKRLYYRTFWRLFELMGRGDQLIVTLRAK